MRAKLERIAAGKIEFDRPVVTLSDSVVTLSCRPGEKAEGSFTLTADRPVKGMAYASTSRMTLEHPSFHSRTARIFCSSPSNSSTKLAWVPVVPLEPSSARLAIR